MRKANRKSSRLIWFRLWLTAGIFVLLMVWYALGFRAGYAKKDREGIGLLDISPPDDRIDCEKWEIKC